MPATPGSASPATSASLADRRYCGYPARKLSGRGLAAGLPLGGTSTFGRGASGGAGRAGTAAGATGSAAGGGAARTGMPMGCGTMIIGGPRGANAAPLPPAPAEVRPPPALTSTGSGPDGVGSETSGRLGRGDCGNELPPPLPLLPPPPVGGLTGKGLDGGGLAGGFAGWGLLCGGLAGATGGRPAMGPLGCS